MFCSQCGFENPEGNDVCVRCGHYLPGVVPAAPPATPVTGFAAEPVKTSGLAIAALVLGILSLFCGFLTALPAIICGIIALVKISGSQGQLKGTGLAVTGIVLPIILTVVSALLLAILMPALNQVKKVAQRTICATNLQGLGNAITVYTMDYDGMLPTENWCDLLIEEADVSPKSFICPQSDAIEGESSYAMNRYVAGKDMDDLPGDVVLLFETEMGHDAGPRDTSITTRRHYDFLNEFGNVYDENTLVYPDRFNQVGGPEVLALPHPDRSSLGSEPGCNILFVDGHVEYITEDRMSELKWQP